MTAPRWLTQARMHLGTREIVGPKHSPIILKWLDRLKAPFRDDESAWCGTFVGGVFDECGIAPIKSPWGARQWLKFGRSLPSPAVGSVVVFWRGDPKGWSGHVGFVAGKDKAGNLMVLGGNQGNAVSIAPFDRKRILGYRWPNGVNDAPDFNLPVMTTTGAISTNEA